MIFKGSGIMIEAMEQKIINSIRSKYLKNKKLRKDIDKEKVAEALRYMCSSRSSFFPIFKKLKSAVAEQNELYTKELLNNLIYKIEEVYKWVTDECIVELLESYENPHIADIKKRNEYIAEAPIIRKELIQLSQEIYPMTLKRLIVFLGIDLDLNLLIGGI